MWHAGADDMEDSEVVKVVDQQTAGEALILFWRLAE
jgi:hypothetical protein